MTIGLSNYVQVINPERDCYGMRGYVTNIFHPSNLPYRVKLEGVGGLVDFEVTELQVVSRVPSIDTTRLHEAVDNFKAALRGGPMAHNTPAENDAIIAAGYEPENRPAELKKTRTSDPQFMALLFVQRNYYPDLPLNEIYVVWFCSTLQNWKCLISTNVKDNHYYEVTHNGELSETYIDQYTKTSQKVEKGDEIVHVTFPKS